MDRTHMTVHAIHFLGTIERLVELYLSDGMKEEQETEQIRSMTKRKRSHKSRNGHVNRFLPII